MTDTILPEYGYTYSHSTEIHRTDGSTYTLHTYRYGDTDQVCSVAPGLRYYFSKLGDGTKYCVMSYHLRRYLRRKVQRIRRSLTEGETC